MRSLLLFSTLLVLAVAAWAVGGESKPVRLMTLDPGHFHAALIQKETYAEVSDTVHVFAPLGPDLLAHMQRISAFNRRAERPTAWQLEVHAGPDPLARMLRERPGNVVVLSGRNKGKIDAILASVEAGLHVLADKPWLIAAADFPKLERALDVAQAKGTIAYDVMTERFEITTLLQRELAQDRAVTGAIGPGSEAEPAIEMESVHHLMKLVAGSINLRPAWFFDTEQQGEALADVATHLVDLVPWILFPEQPIDHRSEVRVSRASRWPTAVDRAQLLRLTGERELPADLAGRLSGERLDYFANGEVAYTVRGHHARVKVIWNFEAPAGGGDTHRSVVRGRRSRLEVLQGPEQAWKPELYVVPRKAEEATAVRSALERRVAEWNRTWPGVALADEGGRFLIEVPARYREGHEAHFAAVTGRFLGYLKNPGSLPAWEKANMLAKYSVTTQALQFSRTQTVGH